MSQNIRFTKEMEYEFQDGYLPTLDFKVKWQEEKFSYTFYEKPMQTKWVTPQNTSACPQATMQELSNEVVRRLSRIS